MAEQKPQVIGNCLWCHERLFMTIPHHCKEMDELPSKLEEQVTTTEQNTKQKWEEKIFKWAHDNNIKLHADKFQPLLDFLASQRHQLKQQVLLKAVGGFEEVDIITEDGDEDVEYEGYVRNEFREELIQRIEAIFEEKET